MDLRKGWKVKFLDHRLEKHILFNVEKLEKYIFCPKMLEFYLLIDVVTM